MTPAPGLKPSPKPCGSGKFRLAAASCLTLADNVRHQAPEPKAAGSMLGLVNVHLTKRAIPSIQHRDHSWCVNDLPPERAGDRRTVADAVIAWAKRMPWTPDSAPRRRFVV